MYYIFMKLTPYLLVFNYCQYSYRTKVECAGQCLIDQSCDTFSFVSNECKLLKSDQLFKDETEQLEIYMEASLAACQYNEYFSVICLLKKIIYFMKDKFNPYKCNFYY